MDELYNMLQNNNVNSISEFVEKKGIEFADLLFNHDDSRSIINKKLGD